MGLGFDVFDEFSLFVGLYVIFDECLNKKEMFCVVWSLVWVLTLFFDLKGFDGFWVFDVSGLPYKLRQLPSDLYQK
jgi:hypothetical protein